MNPQDKGKKGISEKPNKSRPAGKHADEKRHSPRVSGKDTSEKPYKSRSTDKKVAEKRFGSKPEWKDSSEKPYKSRSTDKKVTEKRFGSKPEWKDSSEKPYKSRSTDKKVAEKRFGSKPEWKDSSEKPYRSRSTDKKVAEKRFGSKPEWKDSSEKPYKSKSSDKRSTDNRYKTDRTTKGSAETKNKPAQSERTSFVRGFKPKETEKEFGKSRTFRPRKYSKPKKKQADTNDKGESLIRLNKYLADSGVCSRREADVLIESGVVKVNGEVVSQLGTKVSQTDKVMFGGETLSREKLRYLMLNKPKGFITTSDDPLDRKTVMSLVENACTERIYPIGRLDRNTIGLLLFTNDGDLAKKLTHPKYGIKKIYHVFLDKPLTKTDMIRIIEGVELEDGMAKPDKISYITGEEDKKQVGIELHSGKNRIVRRIFEQLGYDVVKLDRVSFAGLTKKDIPRGKWRMLTDKEVGMLKMISSGT